VARLLAFGALALGGCSPQGPSISSNALGEPVHCALPGDEEWFPVPSAEACREMGGAVWGGLPAAKGSADELPADRLLENQRMSPLSMQVVQDAGVWKKKYVPGVYDCRHFARDLYNALEAAGIDATITFKTCDTNGDGTVNVADGSGHALCDIHNGDGTTTWIEPQWPPPNVVRQDASTPPDGLVGVRNGGAVGGPGYQAAHDTGAGLGGTPTEGNCVLVIFT